MKFLILAGGMGERLWPLSRSHLPKQFLSLADSDKSLLRLSVERVLEFASAEDIFVISPDKYRFYLSDELEKINPDLTKNIIIEPSSKNTAPAILLGVRFLIDELKVDSGQSICVLPSDHLITPANLLYKYIKQADDLAKQGYIVTFGLKPKSAHTGYGYIHTSEMISQGNYKVERFVEKPDSSTAQKFLKQGGYFWNSGIFTFSGQAIIKEYEKSFKDIGDYLKSYNSIRENFSFFPKISVDYAVIESAVKVAMVSLDKLEWHDLGSWDSVYEVIDKDKEGNAKVGKINAFDTKNSLLISKDRLVVASGIEGQIVVDTRDALFVGKRGKTGPVKEIIKEIKKNNLKEVEEGTTLHRPWGSYTILEESANYKIKKIKVKPKKRLSLQYHKERSEHWVVVKGKAKVKIDGKECVISSNQSAFVPKGKPHRLENLQDSVLEIIEVQCGSLVSEADIVRLEDDFLR